jgi:hypothetical protein
LYKSENHSLGNTTVNVGWVNGYRINC